MTNKVKLEFQYYPTSIEYYEYEFELPEGYTYDDIDDLYIRWNDMTIETTDGETHTIEYDLGYATHLETDDKDYDAYKYPDNLEWSPIDE